MIPVTQYWLPIVVATILCFVSGAILHMMIPLHKGDWRQLPDEDGVLAALKRAGVTPGNYMFPNSPAGDMSAMKDPAFQKRLAENPGGVMTIRPAGAIVMGPYLIKQFIYHLVISVLIAFVVGRLVGAGHGFAHVFHYTSILAGLTYVGALFPEVIWYHHPRNYVLAKVVDGVVWALLTGLAFGWLGPKAV
jgi:hypothetical protein